MFRAMFSPIISGTWLYLQHLVIFTNVAAGWWHGWVKTHSCILLVVFVIISLCTDSWTLSLFYYILFNLSLFRYSWTCIYFRKRPVVSMDASTTLSVCTTSSYAVSFLTWFTPLSPFSLPVCGRIAVVAICRHTASVALQHA